MSRRPFPQYTTNNNNSNNNNGSATPPAMYDTSVSSNAASDSNSTSAWSHHRSVGSNISGHPPNNMYHPSQANYVPHHHQQQQQQQAYGFYPKSHPTQQQLQPPPSPGRSVGSHYNQQQQPQQSPKQSQYTMSRYTPQSPRGGRKQFDNQKQNINNNPHPGQPQQQPPQRNFQPPTPQAFQQRQRQSVSPSRQRMNHQYHLQQQHQQQPFAQRMVQQQQQQHYGGGPTNPNMSYTSFSSAASVASSTGGGGGGGSAVGVSNFTQRYDPHHRGVMSEPIVNDQDRFAPHLHRFSREPNHAPPSTIANNHHQHQQQHPANNNTTMHTNPRGAFAPPFAPPRNPSSPPVQQHKQAPPQQGIRPPLGQPTNNNNNNNHQSAMYRRQVSNTSSAGTVASSTASSFNRSRVVDEQLRASPPLSSYPDPELEAMRASPGLSEYEESRTTSSETTRLTRPSRDYHKNKATFQKNMEEEPRRESQQQKQQQPQSTAPSQELTDEASEQRRRGRSPARSDYLPVAQQTLANSNRYASPARSYAGTTNTVATTPNSNNNNLRGRSLSISREAPSEMATPVSPAAPSKTLTSSGVPAVSPGTTRTRSLAERFEQRMRSKGKSSQLKSAMQSAYQQQQSQSSSNSKTNQSPPSLEKEPESIPEELPPPLPLEEKKEAEEDERRHLSAIAANAEIVTPPNASVRELKQKLWDEREAELNVRVKPSLHFTEEELIQQQEREYQKQLQEQRYREEVRQSRSLSPKSARRPYELDSGSHSGSQGSGGLRFKSKFYEAAALSTEFSQSGSANNDNEPGVLGAAASPFQQNSLHPANKASWLKNTGKLEGSEVAHSQATTSKMNNTEHSVSSLLHRLHSVNRGDPNKALMEIDEILKQEAMREDPTAQQSLRVPDAENYMKYRGADIPNRELDDDESDGDTTVSSITNPTYQGHPSATKTETNAEEAEVEHEEKDDDATPRKATHKYLDREAQVQEPSVPVASQQIEHADSGASAFKPVSQGVQTPAVADYESAHPPVNITTREKPIIPESDPMAYEARERLHAKAQSMGIGQRQQEREYVEPEEEEMQVHNNPANSKSDELMRKIQKWDKMTGEDDDYESTTPPQNPNPYLKRETSAREGVQDTDVSLGSIVTPLSPRNSVASPQNVASKSPRTHPWDDQGVDDNINAQFGRKDDARVKEAVSKEPVKQDKSQEEMVNLSNDLSNSFDDAWVALPTSRFFPSAEEEGGKEDHLSARERRRQQSLERNQPDMRQSSRYDSSPGGRRNARSRSASFSGNSRREIRHTSRQELSNDPDAQVEEIEVVAETKKPKRGLRALLQRGRSSNNSQGTASVSTSIVASSRGGGMPQGEERPPPSRGRRNSKGNKSPGRSRSLEERRVRNPNIARKFSRMLRVYNDDENGQI